MTPLVNLHPTFRVVCLGGDSRTFDTFFTHIREIFGMGFITIIIVTNEPELYAHFVRPSHGHNVIRPEECELVLGEIEYYNRERRGTIVNHLMVWDKVPADPIHFITAQKYRISTAVLAVSYFDLKMVFLRWADSVVLLRKPTRRETASMKSDGMNLVDLQEYITINHPTVSNGRTAEGHGQTDCLQQPAGGETQRGSGDEADR